MLKIEERGNIYKIVTKKGPFTRTKMGVSRVAAALAIQAFMTKRLNRYWSNAPERKK